MLVSTGLLVSMIDVLAKNLCASMRATCCYSMTQDLLFYSMSLGGGRSVTQNAVVEQAIRRVRHTCYRNPMQLV